MTTARVAIRRIPFAATGRAAQARRAPMGVGLRLDLLAAGIARAWALFSSAVESARIAESAPPRRARDLISVTWMEQADR